MEEKEHLVFTVSTECQNGCNSAHSHAPPHKQDQGISEPPASPGSASNFTGATSQRLSIQYNESRPPHSIVVSMPDSPAGTRRVVFNQMHEAFMNGKSNQSSSPVPRAEQLEEQKLHPQAESKISFDGVDHLQPAVVLRNDSSLKDKRFDSFKTWSGRLERQLSNLRGRPVETAYDVTGGLPSNEIEALPVDRYFDALEGPELDTLKASEELALPQHEQWPFLLRFPISSFGICLGVGSQAILWRTLATTPSVHFLHVKPTVNFVLWCTAITLLVTISAIYLLKIIFYLEAVKREYYHPVRVNFFFAPWIACLFLAQGLPPSIAVKLPAPLWYILMAPILCLELKIYGQWMSGGQRRLSKVANPSNHLSIVGNFVGALLGASMGIKEGAIFFFAVGLAHYIVLFVTLYQRLPTNETLPKELHPVFFLFVAAPSVACTAWAKINGEFDHGARIAYFIAIFLYLSLVVRVNFFRGFRFSLAWWAYTFPMTGAAIATIRYANEHVSLFTQSLSVVLAAVSTLTVIALLCTTMLHAFIFRDLFPNDISIAITHKKKKSSKKRSHHKSSAVSDSNKESLHSQESI